jgi:hypothetical protein
MSLFAHFDSGLVALHQLNLLPTIFPQLKEVGVEEIQRRLSPLSSYPKGAPTIAELLELFPDQSLPELFSLCDHLKLSRVDRAIVRFLYHAKQLLQMPEDWQENLEKIEWAYFYANPHSQISIKIIAAHLPPDKRGRFLESHKHRHQTLEQAILRIQTNRPIVSADHLMKEGFMPGRKMGLALKEAERISVNQGIEESDVIIQLLKNSDLWNT